MADSQSEVSRVDDFNTHEYTYKGFKTAVRLTIVHMLFLLPALYCLVIAGQGWLGATLLAASVVVPIALLARRL